MKKPVKKTEKIIASIISKLSCGATLTNICWGADMPTLRAVQLWRENDAELEERIHAAWVRGLQTRFDMNYDDQQRLLDNPTNYDPQAHKRDGDYYTRPQPPDHGGSDTIRQTLRSTEQN